MAPTFSIVLPTYNRAGQAVAAVRSALVQTDGDFECLVVDDGSVDGTAEALKRFSDPRLRLFLNQENRGQHACRNQAIRAARAPWICFLDSDDLYLPRRLSELRRAIAGRPSVGFWFTNAYVHRYGRIIGRLFDPGRAIAEGRVPGYYALGDVFLPYVTTTVCLKREAFETIGYYREDLHILEDTELYARMLGAGVEVGALREPLAVRFLHDGQITRDYDTEFAEVLEAIKAARAPQAVQAEIRERLTREVGTYFLKSLQPRAARQVLRREWGGRAYRTPLYWETFAPAAALRAAREARRLWLTLRFSPALAPAEFRRAAAEISPFLAVQSI